MGLEENRAVSTRTLELLNQHDYDGLDEVMASPLLEGFRQALTAILAAFPDYHGENIEQITEGNKVVNRFIAWGTHQGEFMGVAPTGKQITFRGIAIDTIVDGKIGENFIVMDWLSVLQQLGATSIPAPASV